MLLALVGNQNCGKTTLFNQLTGSNQHVGNFPGVTIEHKIGQIIGWKNYDLVDLPGIYSIRPYSGEEKVSRDFIIERKPDAIINIVDATNIERNLYLTLQLIEMGKPMVLALNMMDELLGNHGSVDIQKLSDRLGIPVVPIAYSDKTKNALDEIGYSGKIYDVNNIDTDEVLKSILNAVPYKLDGNIIKSAENHIKRFDEYIKRQC